MTPSSGPSGSFPGASRELAAAGSLLTPWGRQGRRVGSSGKFAGAQNWWAHFADTQQYQ